jgi:glycosyltransferase involved in cell wall biosynthesis
LKVSLITVTFNSALTLADTINSIRDQDYSNIEYIIIDGNSNDRTVQIIKENLDVVSSWISEPDTGLYDAMNKGIKMATGEIVGIINSDDFYHRKDAISKIVEGFSRKEIQCVFADVRFVKSNNLEKTIRYYSSHLDAISRNLDFIELILKSLQILSF